MTLCSDDYLQLKSLVTSQLTCALSDPAMLRSLHQEIQRATLVPATELTDVIVGMNSTITLRDLRSKAIETYTLVFPAQADIANGRLSVLSPMGVEVLGCRCGDQIGWLTHSGWRTMRIEKVVSLRVHRIGQPVKDGKNILQGGVPVRRSADDELSIKNVLTAAVSGSRVPRESAQKPRVFLREKEP